LGVQEIKGAIIRVAACGTSGKSGLHARGRGQITGRFRGTVNGQTTELSVREEVVAVGGEVGEFVGTGSGTKEGPFWPRKIIQFS
jgi:hypothetical protein